jgi:hypothetical protein
LLRSVFGKEWMGENVAKARPEKRPLGEEQVDERFALLCKLVVIGRFFTQNS